MIRSELPPNKTATYVMKKWKTVYVSVPKAACTSLKWMVADLQEEDPAHFYQALSRETGRSMTIHHRARWQKTPMLNELSDDELAEIHPDNGWFVFGVVRHPSARLWSGWQSKFLLREPHFFAHYPEAPWPRLPESTEDVVEDYQTFVQTLGREPEQPIFGDRHFRSQSDLLRDDKVPYSRIYKTAEFGQLMSDLEAHLKPFGLDQMPRLRRSNETPLLPVAGLFTPEANAVVEQHYAADFARFGYPDVVPDTLSPSPEYTPELLAEVGRLVERGERIGDLYLLANQQRRRMRQEIRGIRREHRKKLARATAPPPTTLQRVRGKAGRVARRGLRAVRRGDVSGS
ncbi:MAG: sulfotransferase family 2 domain-containing protein [Nocardioidaceae bacterium]